MNIVRNIEKSFYPEIYPDSTPINHYLKLCLVKTNGLARYVLIVIDFDSSIDFKTQIEQARMSIRQQTSAMWLFREVGAYIVFVCDELPNVNRSQIKVDKTGFHAVIIQGIHLVSKSGNHLYNHAKWSHRSFGGTECIAARIVNSAI
ncbi:hypothetical protein J7384_16690 [Endozoicomonas sp. G2_1]|uniref:hypothetical protein n=1 Tax=Endozoicomonas sp. G2_1 TaxID=2821091 RepID=UPI001AD9CFBC|nr:hypothetical protein [Endozoicomonas sp. G2_1]MBO9492000.1 hypothetical protein [Endozoicomonas sp. G2_1]